MPPLYGTPSVLDDFDTDILTTVNSNGTGTSAGLPDVGGTVTSDSITGRRDIGVFRDATLGGTNDFAEANVQSGAFSRLSIANSPNATAWLQNDYGTPFGNSSSNNLLSEVDLTGASGIISQGFSDLRQLTSKSATAGIDVTFTVWGDTTSDYATSDTQTTAGGAELLHF